MKKKLLAVILLVSLLVALVVLTGCTTPVTPAQLDKVSKDLTAKIEDVERNANDRLDDLESDLGDLEDDVRGVETPDLSSYVTDSELDSKLDSFIDSLSDDEIATLKEMLGIDGGDGTTSGKVTAEIVAGQNLDYYATEMRDIFSNDTCRFTLEVANGSDDIQYIKVGLVLELSSGTAPGTLSATLDNLTSGIAYKAYPASDNVSITFIPSSTNTRFRVRDGESEEVSFRLTVKTGITTGWEGYLTWNASDTW